MAFETPEAIQEIILAPEWHDILAVLKGARNGLVYGTKIRFPHALVMTFLFRNGSFRDKMTFVLKATYRHAKNLGTFVFIYKSLMKSLKAMNANKEHTSHAFFGGLIGGYMVFGEDNNINQQINLYLLSRITVGMAKLMVEKGILPTPAPGVTFPIFGSVVWAIVMWLFRHHRHVLQGSLQSSMQYLYNDSEHWHDLRNLFWHNK